MCAHLQLRAPQLLSSPGIECSETFVVGCGNKHQSACRRNRSSHVQTAGVLFLFRQFVRYTKRHSPGDVASIRIHCDQVAPGRFLAWPGVRSGVVDVAGPRVALAPLESRRWSDDAVPAISIAALSCRSFFDPADAGFVLCIDEHISQRRIRSSAAPVHTADGSGEKHRGPRFGAVLLEEIWRERPYVV